MQTSAKRACKPDSVPRTSETGRRPSIWSLRCRKGSCGLPGDCSRALRSAERRRPPIWPCSGWGLPASRLAPGPGALLPHRFTLACPPRERGAIGAMVSVALSVASLRLGVTQHPARRSPDFPPRRRRSGRPALLTCSVYACGSTLTHRCWIPAFAGMTGSTREMFRLRCAPLNMTRTASGG